jgi:hypothetical protein
MAIQPYRQNAFNSGELSPRLKGRTDLGKYKTGLQTCLNATPLAQGGITERSGFRFMAETKDSTKATELVPFEFSETQSYILEFGDLYMRVYTDGGQVVAPDSYTLLLLHYYGVDTSVTFTDDSDSALTVTANGNAQIDTAQYYFNTSSGTFDGSGDYLSIPDHANFNLGQGFTIDTWIRFNSVSGIHTLYFQEDATAGDYVWWWVDHAASTMNCRVVSAGAIVANISETWAPIADTWYHVALIDGWNANLIPNAGFEADSTWTKGTGWTIGSGVASSSGAQTTTSSIYQNAVISDSTAYVTSFDITAYTAGSINLELGGGGGASSGAARAGVGTYTESMTSNGTNLSLVATADFVGSIDNIQVYVSGTTALAMIVDGSVLGLPAAFAGTFPDLDGQVTLWGKANADDIFDYSTQCHVITKVNDATVSDGASKFRDASIYFDGTGDALTMPDSGVNWDFFNEDYVYFQFWVKFSDHVGIENLVSNYEAGANYWAFHHTHGSGFQLQLKTAGVDELLTPPRGEITDTNWHHVLVSREGSEQAIWLDGAQIVAHYDASKDTFTGNLELGGLNAGATNPFQGYIEDFRFDHTYLSAVTLGRPILDYSYEFHGWLNFEDNDKTPTISTTSKWGNSAMFFDGTDDYAYYADDAAWDIGSSTNFTISIWVKHDSHVGVDRYVEQYEDGNNRWAFHHTHATGIGFLIDGDAHSGGTYSADGGEITDTNWHHVAAIKVGTDLGVYLDGAQTGYVSYTESDTFAGALNIGAYAGLSEFFPGYMDDLYISKTNYFSAAPDAGLTDTITVPTDTLYGDRANAMLMMPFNHDAITVPTAPIGVGASTKLYIQADLYDMDGWADETRLSNVTRWTKNFALNTQEYPAAGGSIPYEIVSPYDTDDDISLLRVLQSADTLYIAHPNYNIRKLTRSDHDSWAFAEIDWNQPPWNDVNTTATTLSLDNGAVGAGKTLTASASMFTALHVGAYFKFDTGLLRCTAYVSGTEMTCTVKTQFDVIAATTSWYQGVWDDTQGYPTSLAFHEDRLVAVGDLYHPLRVFFSGTGDYENMGLVTSPTQIDSDPLSNDVWAQKLNLLKWVYSGKRLFLGTVGSEYWMTGSTVDTPITPTSIQAKRETGWGSSSPAPIQIGQSMIFVQKDGKKLRDWHYVNEEGGYLGVDLNILSEHLTIGTTIKKMQYAQDPNQIVWIVMADGQLASMTYLKDHKVVGFAEHTTTDSTGAGLFETCAVIPGDTGDELWVVVQRTVNGSTKKFIERLHPEFFGGSITTNAFFVDSGLSTYETGDPASVFGGMEHLEAETVQVLADGVYHGDYVVTNGEFTLTGGATATNVHAGLGYNMDLKTLMPDGDGPQSTGVTQKRIFEVGLELYETGIGGAIGAASNDLHDIMSMTSGALNTDIYQQEFNGEYDLFPSMFIRQADPLPFTLLGLIKHIELQEDDE